MYHWVTDNQFLKKSYSISADIVNQLVQHLKHYEINTKMYTVGSKSRNMVTQNEKKEIDYDFNLLIIESSKFSINNCKYLKEIIRKAFNEVLKQNGWQDCEDSHSVLTTKKYSFKKGNHTPFSIDVSIVRIDSYGRINRLIHDKKGISWMDGYYWNQETKYKDLNTKENFLKSNNYWKEVRQTYLDKKNFYLRSNNNNHSSHNCYIESVNEVYYKKNNSIQYSFINLYTGKMITGGNINDR